jgi:lysophospholipase L1-like esterase
MIGKHGGAALLLAASLSYCASAGIPGEFNVRDGLPNFFAKLTAGGEVRIAYLGGSITAAQGWRILSQQWFAGQYPDAEIKEVFAAIPGTGGELGVSRLDEDVIAHRPDLVFIEFCVNGIGRTQERGRQVTEGLIRKIWTALPETDICFVYTVGSWHFADFEKTGIQWTAGIMEEVLPHYGVPSINFAAEVCRRLNEDTLVFSRPKGEPVPDGKLLFSHDGVHPLVDTGHVLYNEAVIRAMTAMKKTGTPGPHGLPAALEPASWAEANRVPLSRAVLTGEWTVHHPVDVPGNQKEIASRNFKERFTELWQAEWAGAEIVFQFEGTGFGLYGISRCESGQFEVQVDRHQPLQETLFDSYAGTGRAKGWFYPHTLSSGTHTVRVRLMREPPDKAGIFLKANKQMSGPRYERNELFFGDLLINGRLVELPGEE